MRRARRLTTKITGISLLIVCVGLFLSITPSIKSEIKSLFPSVQQESEKNLAAAKEVPSVVEKVITDTASTQASTQLVAVAKDYVKSETVLGVNGEWIPGDQSYKVGPYLNGKLLGKGGPTVVIKEILEKKEQYGLNFMGNGPTKESRVVSKPGDPVVRKFVGLCSAKTGKMAGAATVNFSAIPIPKFLTQGLELSQRQISDKVFATIDKAFIDGLTPSQYENFCQYVEKAGPYYQDLATGVIFKNKASANSKGDNFFESVITKCATRAPGKEQGAAFAKEWLEEEQGLKTVTFKVAVDNNLQDSDIIAQGTQDLLVKKGGLSGLRGYATGNDNFMYVWQPAQAPKQVKNAAVSVASKVMYDRLIASPTKDSTTLGESQVFDGTGNTTILSTGHMIQTETSRETIIAALVGGMYYLPTEAIKTGNNYSMLYWDPVKADPKQTYCDVNEGGDKGRCVVVNSESSCTGGFGIDITNPLTGKVITLGGYLAVQGDVRLNMIQLSTVDTQQWSAMSQGGKVLSYANAGKKTLASVVERPNYLTTATIEQIALAGDRTKLTNRCAATLEPIVNAQMGAGMGIDGNKMSSLSNYIMDIGGFKLQAFLALPVQVTGKVHMPFINIWGKKDIRTSDLSGRDFIPAIYELKLDDLWGGVEGLAVGDVNATDAAALIDGALKREGVLQMTDGKVDCELNTATSATMWPCQTTGGALFGKCQ